MKKFTTTDFKRCKETGEKITMITAYDYTYAQIVEEAGIEVILVGDSLGMTVLGYEDTLAVTMEEMIHHTRAVRRGAKLPFLVADMPFMSYQVSVEQAIANAGRLIKETGANAVKLEGGESVAEKVKAVVDAQIPVMGHIGLTPQSVNAFGGFKVQGKDVEAARQLIADAKALERAGCFSIVIEGVPEKLAARITQSVGIPTIGIGAGAGCDGQVLVLQDMLGLFSDMSPKFVKHYAELRQVTVEAFTRYATEVKNSVFPAKEHTFSVSDEVLEKLYTS
ncbi:MAG: 3-methyl-2-oxobutanoate hydroxymethyltransferase [Bacillota bacterium]|nr:3-methyl-2-oxobutanoate hydroxymethyltransferase [Bacillota bacterium]